MPTKCCWVIHGRLTSERKASTSPSSSINHSTLLLDRALKRQAPSLSLHALWALDRLRTRRLVHVGSTRRRGNHMHDHSRFQRDIDDVTGISLSLSLSLSLYYYSQKSLTHNIGSASALPIIRKQTKTSRVVPGSIWLTQLILVLPGDKGTADLVNLLRSNFRVWLIWWFPFSISNESTHVPLLKVPCEKPDNLWRVLCRAGVTCRYFMVLFLQHCLWL